MQTILPQEQLSRLMMDRVEPKFRALKTKLFDLVGDDGKMPPWLRIIYCAQYQFYNVLYETKRPNNSPSALSHGAKFFMPFTDLCDFFIQEETRQEE